MAVRMPLKSVGSLKRRVSHLLGLESDTQLDLESEQSPPDFEAGPSASPLENKRSSPTDNPALEEEIWQSIEAIFYDPNFDACEYELKKLSQEWDVNSIISDKHLKKQQLSVVNKKVSELILKNGPSHVAELQKITDLKCAVEKLYATCHEARQRVQQVNVERTVLSLKVLALYYRRSCLANVLDAIRRIQTLQQTDKNILALIDAQDFAGAVKLCLEGIRTVQLYQQYQCIRDLNHKLQDTLNGLEHDLDVFAAACSVRIDLHRYANIYSAFNLLNKTEVLSESLVHHFSTTIHNTATALLQQTVPSADPSLSGQADFNDLCQNLPYARLPDTLRELLRILWHILFNYQSLVSWHEGNRSIGEIGISASEEFLSVLNGGVERLWFDVSCKLDSLVHHCDFRSFKLGDFLFVLAVCSRFLKAYERLCKTSSDQFKHTLRTKCLEFFDNYHQRCMEEVKMFVETDAWEKVPVQRGYSWRLIPEFRELCKLEQSNVQRNAVEEPIDWNSATDPESCNPFDVSNFPDAEETTSTREVSDSDDSDMSDENKAETNDDDELADELLPCFHTPAKRIPIDQLGPLLSNSALILLRFFGRYLNFACLVESVMSDIIVPLAELYEYYFISIYKTFDCGLEESFCDASLLLCVQRIEAKLAAASRTLPRCDKSAHALSATSLATFMHRVVGVESLIFVSDQLIDMIPLLDSLLPKIKQAFLRLFSAQSLKMARLIRKPAYCAIGKVFLNYGSILESMSTVNWDVKELMLRHSPFTDDIIEQLMKLKTFLSPRNPKVCLPDEVWTTVWSGVGEKLFAVLVEGFSDARKCTDEGRALMQRNFQQLLINLEAIADKKMTSGKTLVENYIKAFYLNDSSIEQWIKENRTVYSDKQLTSLLNVAPLLTKKTKQKIKNSFSGAAEEPGDS